MRPDVLPTACLPFEPEEAHRLQWLPLAVRHKLDGCRLHLSLVEWQALPVATRQQLLQLPAGPQFCERARFLGASREVRTRQLAPLRVADVSKALRCDASAARAWLTTATPFAHYVLGKRLNAAA